MTVEVALITVFLALLAVALGYPILAPFVPIMVCVVLAAGRLAIYFIVHLVRWANARG